MISSAGSASSSSSASPCRRPAPGRGCSSRARRQARLVRSPAVVVASILRLQRIVEKRRQRRGDDDLGFHGMTCRWVERHSSGGNESSANHAMRRQVRRRSHATGWANRRSSAAMSRVARIGRDHAVEPQRCALRDARVRNERRRRREMRVRAMASSKRPQVVEPFAAGQRRPRRCGPRQRFDQAGGTRLRARARDSSRPRRPSRRARPAFRRAARDRRRRERSARACRRPAQFGQREQPFAVHALSSACARRRCPPPRARRGARPGRERDQPRRPRARIADAVFDRVGADEDRVVVAVELALRAIERAPIGRRQDDDRGKDERRAADRRDLLRQRRRLPRRPRDEDALPVEAAGRHRRARSRDPDCIARPRRRPGRAPRALIAACNRAFILRARARRRARASRRPARRRARPLRSIGGHARFALPRITSLPSRLAIRPRSHKLRRAASRSRRAACGNRRPGAPEGALGGDGERGRADATSARDAHRPRRARSPAFDADAPCPMAGRLSSGSSSAAMRSPRPSRFRPATARMIAAYCALVELAQARVDVAAQRLAYERRDSARAAAPRGAGSTCRPRSPGGRLASDA